VNPFTSVHAGKTLSQWTDTLQKPKKTQKKKK